MELKRIEMELNKRYKDMEKLNDWFDWITTKGNKLGKVICKSPNISRDKAFNVLYTLQEFLGIISDEIEMCKDCKRLLNTSCEDWINVEGQEYKEFAVKRKPRKHEEGIYCDDCARNRFGFA